MLPVSPKCPTDEQDDEDEDDEESGLLLLIDAMVSKAVLDDNLVDVVDLSVRLLYGRRSRLDA